MLNRTRLMTVAAAMACFAGTAGAQAVISNGTLRMGIDLLGQLNTGSVEQISGTSTVGLRLITSAGDYESTADGCVCEGWGVGVRTGGELTASGHANNFSGIDNLTDVSFASTATTATSTVRLSSGADLQVTHAYKPSSTTPNLYEVTVTITNTGMMDFEDIVYRRVMDWDIAPTQFAENVRISGWGATNLIGSGDNGFLRARPLEGGVTDCTIDALCNANFETVDGADRGSFFDFSFGMLKFGESFTFTTFYGAAPTLQGLLAALGSVGAEVYSAAWCAGPSAACVGKDGPAVFGYGFKGVGGAVPPELGVIPEPSTYVMLATGLLGLAGYSRRRRTNA